MNRFSSAKVLALSLMLTACVTGIQENPKEFVEEAGLRPATAGLLDKLDGRKNLIGLDTEQLIDESMGNCPTNELEIPGEGLRLQGGIGGLAVAPYPTGTQSGEVEPVVEQIINQFSYNLDELSAILVVDDFNGQGVSVPGVYFPDQSALGKLLGLPKDPDERAKQQEAMMDRLEAGRQLSHGALVFNHTLSLLSALDPDLNVSILRVDKPASPVKNVTFAFAPLDVTVAAFPNLGITVVAVDTEDFDTDVIAGRIAATLQLLASEQGVKRFAVNLSFGLVPCSVLEDFRANKEEYATFEAYQEAVLKANKLDATQFRGELVSLLTTLVGSDPLRVLAGQDPENFGGATAIAYLAAAGNYRMDRSLYPGYWSGFASTSAENLSGPAGVKDSAYSNTGEVLLPGGFYQLSLYDPATRTWTTAPDISVAGTSFAAPVLSVFTALDYTNFVPRCSFVRGQGTPLAFYDTDQPKRAVPTLDEPLERAVKTYCKP